MKASVLLFTCFVAAEAAYAQRLAVSPDLSPEAAGQIFIRTVIDICLPAAAGRSVSASGSAQTGRLQPTQDAATRRQARAEAEETVWDVVAARGVVTVREKPGRCVVSVYGPGAAQTIGSLRQALTATPAHDLLSSVRGASEELDETLSVSSGEHVLRLRLSGSEPQTPGHQSRFAVVTASVSLAR